eukprot:4031384-Pyramimonas_sp.AAC.1
MSREEGKGRAMRAGGARSQKAVLHAAAVAQAPCGQRHRFEIKEPRDNTQNHEITDPGIGTPTNQDMGVVPEWVGF